MKTIHFFLLSLLFLSACRNQNVQTLADADMTSDTMPVQSDENIMDETMTIDTADAKRWLIEVIENHLNEGGYAMEDICTPRYYEYKTDATQVGYDGGMEEDAFLKKWSKTYNPKFSGMGTAFMISGQDNGQVKVTNCTLKSNSGAGFIIFNVTIDDKDFKQAYHRDIKIVPVGKAYLIDDIVEFD